MKERTSTSYTKVKNRYPHYIMVARSVKASEGDANTSPLNLHQAMTEVSGDLTFEENTRLGEIVGILIAIGYAYGNTPTSELPAHIQSFLNSKWSSTTEAVKSCVTQLTDKINAQYP